MSQSTLDDDELFGEAADEMRADVESALAAARDALPAPAAIWDAQGENALGTLNALSSALSADEVESHLRDAKKWYTMGQRADAFDTADDLASEIEDLEELLEELKSTQEAVGDLTGTLPALRDSLQQYEEE